MKHFYKFYYDNDELICHVANDYQDIYKRGIDARMELRKIDREFYENIQISSKKISFNNERYHVIIKDFNQFYQDGYFDILKNTMPKIKQAITKFKRKENSKKLVNNVVRNGYKVVAGGLVLALLSTGTSKIITTIINEDENKVTNEFSIDTYPIEEKDISDEERIENFLNEMKSLEAELETTEKKDYIMQKNINTTYLEYENMRYSKKGEYAYENYIAIVEKYSEKWGISKSTIMAMLTQESGGMEVNLMQIQFYSWEDQIIRAYNFRDGRYETFVLTNNPEKYKNENIMCITEQDLKNPITNISIGCVLLRKSAEMMNYHIGASIQCYNFGCSNMETVLALTSKQTDLSIKELLSDQTNLQFMDYTHIIDAGDDEYLNHVIQYADPKSVFTIKYLDKDGQVQENNVSILPESQKHMSQ